MLTMPRLRFRQLPTILRNLPPWSTLRLMKTYASRLLTVSRRSMFVIDELMLLDRLRTISLSLTSRWSLVIAALMKVVGD